MKSLLTVHPTPPLLTQKSAEFLSFINSGTAYLNGSYLFPSSSSSFSAFQQSIATALTSSASTLVTSQYAAVVQGYKAIYGAQMESVLPTEGLVELLLNLNAPGQVTIQAALQIPFRFVVSRMMFFLVGREADGRKTKSGKVVHQLYISIRPPCY